MKAHNKEYRKKNKERIREVNKRYREKLGEVFKERAREYARGWRKRHPEKSRQVVLNYALKNKVKVRERRQASARKLKIEVLTHYAGDILGCVTCGESRLACLSIDHIAGGGYQERKNANKNGTRLYQWLKSEGYPEGYQTLCMNCQFIKREDQKEFRYAKNQ
ncbi:hypothetical protein LCGC14_1322790 [marine sediment metagenome]|uniref:Uncharacterized protein n=1 Tax=marine sediment metagenome TaxID=412755 RepID=A0A0F9MZT5_9ZZZZ